MALTLAATLLFSTVQLCDSFFQGQQNMRFSIPPDHLEHQGLVSDMDHWGTRLPELHTHHVRIPDDANLKIVTPTPAGPGNMIATLPAPCLCGLSVTHALPQATDLSYVLRFPPQAMLSDLSLCIIVCSPRHLGSSLSLARSASWCSLALWPFQW